jgi:hypothetical protein
MDEFEFFFCQFPNPWALRVSGMGCYTSKCGKKIQNHYTLLFNLPTHVLSTEHFWSVQSVSSLHSEMNKHFLVYVFRSYAFGGRLNTVLQIILNKKNVFLKAQAGLEGKYNMYMFGF